MPRKTRKVTLVLVNAKSWWFKLRWKLGTDKSNGVCKWPAWGTREKLASLDQEKETETRRESSVLHWARQVWTEDLGLRTRNDRMILSRGWGVVWAKAQCWDLSGWDPVFHALGKGIPEAEPQTHGPGVSLEQRPSTFLMLRPFHTVPHVVVIPNHTVIFIATS